MLVVHLKNQVTFQSSQVQKQKNMKKKESVHLSITDQGEVWHSWSKRPSFPSLMYPSDRSASLSLKTYGQEGQSWNCPSNFCFLKFSILKIAKIYD